MRSYDPAEYAPYLLGLSLRMPSWVMRRVESIQLIDDASERHRVSMDFLLAEEEVVGQEYVELISAGLLPATIIPIAFLAKKPLAEFNLTGHDGKPLSLLSQAEATDLAVAMLLELGRQQGVDAAIVAGEIRDIVDAPVDVATRRLQHFTQVTDGNAVKLETALALMTHSSFRYLIRMLSIRFMALAWAPATTAESRQVLKYSYVTELSWPARQYAVRLSWRPITFRQPLPAVRLSGSYHIEVGSPEGADVVSARLEQSPSTRSGSARVEDSTRGRARVAHLQAKGRAYEDANPYFVHFEIMPQRRGFIRGITVATASVFLTLLGYYLNDPSSATPVAALLVAPGLLAAWAARPNEHALVSRLVLSLRVFVAMSAAMAFAAALTVQGLLVPACWTSGTLLACMITSGICFLVTMIAYVQTGRKR